ncbi:MAG: gamma-glutamyltransferase [Actinomycetota bacterium]|nr:gamma-glutamyltransferase [Actinomycetota bacterium]
MELHASGRNWAIASPTVLATQAGAAAFERGGNAVDAALAAATVLAVTYPHNCGVGGDLFALVQHPTGDVVAINASGRAPLAIDVAAARAEGDGTSMPAYGPLSITVPGATSGWEALHARGAALPWADAFAPAIALAHDGADVPRSLARKLQTDGEHLAADPGIRAVFFPDGEPLAAGELLRQPALGATLQAVAAEGADALYRGEVGARYVDGLRAAGSPMTRTDLAAHTADLLSPLRGRYRDLDILVVPPNSQGFVLLEILAVIERLGIDPDPLGPDAPSLARVIRATASDRDRHLADADHMKVHPPTLLDDGHLAAICDEVRGNAGFDEQAGPHEGGDTIALVAADASGFAVSLIQSLFYGFGSGILEPDTGIVAHDRGAGFTLEAGHPNELSPGKRPAHTLMPVIVQREGKPVIVSGSRGGYAQPQINAANLIRVVDLGMSASVALAAPRWLSAGMEPESAEPMILAEDDVPLATRDALREGGFRIEAIGSHDEHTGHAHLICVTDKGFDAGSDPRADGGTVAN